LKNFPNRCCSSPLCGRCRGTHRRTLLGAYLLLTDTMSSEAKASISLILLEYRNRIQTCDLCLRRATVLAEQLVQPIARIGCCVPPQPSILAISHGTIRTAFAFRRFPAIACCASVIDPRRLQDRISLIFTVQQAITALMGRPETFAFLGFTHFCDKTRNGRFIVRRKTQRMRLGTPVVLLLVFGESFRTAMDGTIVQKDLKIRII